MAQLSLTCKNCTKSFKREIRNINRSKNHFCTISCGTIYNNKKRLKKLPRFGTCKCSKKIPVRNRFCKTCHPNYVDWNKRTLADLQKLGTYNKHRYLRDHSLRTYKNSGNKYVCLNCKYDKHVDICHLKEAQSFSMNTPISVVNNIKNLVPMCKNCHWEFDNGFLDKKKIVKKWTKSGTFRAF